MWNLFQKNGPVEVFTEYSYSQRFEKRYCLTIVALLLLQFSQLCFFVIYCSVDKCNSFNRGCSAA